MDPDAALKQLREWSKTVNTDAPHYSVFNPTLEEVMEVFDGLDNWLSAGGFKPEAWSDNLKKLRTQIPPI